MGRKTYIENEEEYVIKLSDFKPPQPTGMLVHINLIYQQGFLVPGQAVVCDLCLLFFFYS